MSTPTTISPHMSVHTGKLSAPSPFLLCVCCPRRGQELPPAAHLLDLHSHLSGPRHQRLPHLLDRQPVRPLSTPPPDPFVDETCPHLTMETPTMHGSVNVDAEYSSSILLMEWLSRCIMNNDDVAGIRASRSAATSSTCSGSPACVAPWPTPVPRRYVRGPIYRHTGAHTRRPRGIERRADF